MRDFGYLYRIGYIRLDSLTGFAAPHYTGETEFHPSSDLASSCLTGDRLVTDTRNDRCRSTEIIFAKQNLMQILWIILA